EALYFLTGEHREYNRKAGAFERVVPYENFFCLRGEEGLLSGRGAWQVGARYSRLNLNDGSLQGGVIEDVTLGLNWFLNPNLKWQWNVVGTHRDSVAGVDGTFYGLGSRVAFDF
ncbi:MAG TPA: porin, partial [Pirellulales bacterium]